MSFDKIFDLTAGVYFNFYNKARSEYHTQLAKMSFDKIFDLTAGVYFNFYNIILENVWPSRPHAAVRPDGEVVRGVQYSAPDIQRKESI